MSIDKFDERANIISRMIDETPATIYVKTSQVNAPSETPSSSGGGDPESKGKGNNKPKKKNKKGGRKKK